MLGLAREQSMRGRIVDLSDMHKANTTIGGKTVNGPLFEFKQSDVNQVSRVASSWSETCLPRESCLTLHTNSFTIDWQKVLITSIDAIQENDFQVVQTKTIKGPLFACTD